MDAIELVFTVAMAVLVVGVPLGLTCLLGALVRTTAGAGLADGRPLPSGAMAHAAQTFARVRTHMLQLQFPAPVPETAVPFAAVAEAPVDEVAPGEVAASPLERRAHRQPKRARAIGAATRSRPATATRRSRTRTRRRPAEAQPAS